MQREITREALRKRRQERPKGGGGLVPPVETEDATGRGARHGERGEREGVVGGKSEGARRGV